MLLALLSIGSNFFGLSPFKAVLDLYLFLFGLLACVLEFKERVFTLKYLEIIKKEALFLYRPYGRAAFYFFIGLLVISQGGLLGLLVGLYTSAVGVIIFYASRSVITSLNTLKQSQYTEQQIAEKFQLFDKDNSGYLDSSELSSLCTSLGIVKFYYYKISIIYVVYQLYKK